MNGVNDVEGVDTGGIHVDSGGGCLRRVIDIVKVQVRGASGGYVAGRGFECNHIVPTKVESLGHSRDQSVHTHVVVV